MGPRIKTKDYGLKTKNFLLYLQQIIINSYFNPMNIKLHTPKTLKMGSGLTSMKQFLLSIIATSISIALTFGTAAVIDHHKKQQAKKEMVMMVINDFDKTIEMVQKADTTLREASRTEQELAMHPERFALLRNKFLPTMKLAQESFPETIEKIFSTSIETFNTIGDVNFVNEVSSFYLTRQQYKSSVLDTFRKDVEGKGIIMSPKTLFEVNFPEYAYLNWAFLQDMKETRDKCMQMMNVSEKDMIKFSEQQTHYKVNTARDSLNLEMQEEFRKAETLLLEAQEKLKD